MKEPEPSAIFEHFETASDADLLLAVAGLRLLLADAVSAGAPATESFCSASLRALGREGARREYPCYDSLRSAVLQPLMQYARRKDLAEDPAIN